MSMGSNSRAQRRAHPAPHEAKPAEGKSEVSPFEHWRHTIDERIRMILPSFVGFKELQHKVDQLAKRVAALEAELARRRPEAIVWE